MCEILLSINPEHVENIFNGKKEYEYRKTKCRRDIDKIIIYSTNPVKMVVGEATVQSVLQATPNKIWEMTGKKAGIDKEFFDKYYENHGQAVAYHLVNVIKYVKPKQLSEYGLKSAPQSFAYMRKL